MRTWPITLAAVFELLLAGVIIWTNASLLKSPHGGTAEKVWLGFGACLAVSSIGLFLRQTWARIALIIVASLLTLISAAYVFRNGLHAAEGGGPEALKFMTIAAMLVTQLFVLGALILAWPKRP